MNRRNNKTPINLKMMMIKPMTLTNLLNNNRSNPKGYKILSKMKKRNKKRCRVVKISHKV